MNAREVLELNAGLKRRLQGGMGSSLYDALGRKVDAQFIACDVAHVFQDHRTPLDKYRVDVGQGSSKKTFTSNEAKLLLGYDLRTAAEEIDKLAMLKAVEGGMGGSRTNAYWLGATIFEGKREGFTLPIAFFIIPKKQYNSLIVTPTNFEFRDLIELVERENTRVLR